MISMKKNDERIRDITLSPSIIENVAQTGEAFNRNISQKRNASTTINSVEGIEINKETATIPREQKLENDSNSSVGKEKENTDSSLPLLDIEKKDIHKDLIIRKILEENISFTFEEQLYQFDSEDLGNIIDKLNDNRNKDLVLKGGYARVLKYQKKSNTTNLLDTDFMIKIFNNISLNDSEKGCNNGLEVQILKDLAKTYKSYSPYLHHVILDFDYPLAKKLVVVMECFDHDLRTPPIFGVKRMSNPRPILAKNHFWCALSQD